MSSKQFKEKKFESKSITADTPLHPVCGGVVAEEALTAAERRNEQLAVPVRHEAHVGDHPRAGLIIPPATARPVRTGWVRTAVQPPHLSNINST